MLPSVAQEIILIKLFFQTDPSVLPVSLVVRVLAHLGTLVFLALLIVMFVVRQVPLRTAPGFYSRFAAVAGTYLSFGISLLPQQEVSSALYFVSFFLIISGTLVAISAVLALGRSISILPEARVGSLRPHTTSTLSRRDRCHFWDCATVPPPVGAIAGGTGM